MKKYFLISYSYYGPNGLYGHGEMAVMADIFPEKKVILDAANADNGSDMIIILGIYQFPSELEYNTFYGKS